MTFKGKQSRSFEMIQSRKTVGRLCAQVACIALMMLGMASSAGAIQERRDGDRERDENRERELKQHAARNLAAAAEALHALGRADQAELARRWSAELSGQTAERERGQEGERRREGEPRREGEREQPRDEPREQPRDEPREEENRELQMVRHQLELLELALPALREGEREEAIGTVEKAMEARHVILANPRNPEAQAMWRRAPNREVLVRILVMAEGIYREYGVEERAAKVSALTEELFGGRRRDRESEERREGEGERRQGERSEGREARGERDQPRESDEPRERPRTEREVAIEQIEIMRSGLPALREAGRQDAAELLQRAIRAREIRIEGRRGEEAQEILENEPSLGNQVELLVFSGRLWEEFGQPQKAEALINLGEQFAQRMRAREGRERRTEGEERREGEDRREGERGGEDGGADRERAEEREAKARELSNAIRALETRLEQLKRELNEVQGDRRR